MRLFISYRRDDTLNVAGRMKTELERVPGVRRVFFDLDTIEYGENFETRIATALRESSHCLVVMGRRWAGPKADGAARIAEPEDFVRQEVTTALASKTQVLPILVDGARMPNRDELPDDVAPLSSLNAFELRSKHFTKDLETIVETILGRKKGRRYPARSPLALALWAAGGAAIAFALLVCAGVVSSLAFPTRPSLAHRVQGLFGLPTLEAALGPLILMSFGFVTLGAVVALLWGRRR